MTKPSRIDPSALSIVDEPYTDGRARERCDDGQGGVWWINPEEKPKTVWQGLRKAA